MTQLPLDQLLEELIVSPLTTIPFKGNKDGIYNPPDITIYPFTLPREIKLNTYPKTSIREEPTDPQQRIQDPSIIYVTPTKYYFTQLEFNELYNKVLTLNTLEMKGSEHYSNIIIEFTDPKEQVAIDLKRILETQNKGTFWIKQVDYRNTVWKNEQPVPFDICDTNWYNQTIPQPIRFNPTPETTQSVLIITPSTREYFIPFLKQYIEEKI